MGRDKAETTVADLSGGERARLLLNMVAREAPHLLILDEPTNHLDIDSRRALLDALNDYEGAVLLITHDRSLMELVADRFWLTAGGTIRPFDGDLEDYARLVLEQRGPPPRAEAGRPTRTGAAGRRASRRSAIGSRAPSRRWRRPPARPRRSTRRSPIRALPARTGPRSRPRPPRVKAKDTSTAPKRPGSRLPRPTETARPPLAALDHGGVARLGVEHGVGAPRDVILGDQAGAAVDAPQAGVDRHGDG